MIVGIQPDSTGYSDYAGRWAEFLRARDVEVRTLDLLGRDPLGQARGCDGVMWNWQFYPADKQTGRTLLLLIDRQLGIPVFPDDATAWHYDEKVWQDPLLRALDAPVPEAWVFYREPDALAWARTAPYPVVFKLSVGAGSSNVLKVADERAATSLIRRMFRRGVFPYTMNEQRLPAIPRTRAHASALARRLFEGVRYLASGDYPCLHPVYWRPEHGYAYFQEFLPDNEFDTRVTVIGERAFAFRRMNRPGDFRASGSGRIDHDAGAIDRRCLELAFRASERGAFQCMSYDFLRKRGEPVIGEISYTFASWAVHACPGHWNRRLEWIEGKMWPEEAQVEDFVARIRQRARA